jgi:hypothetical protein
LTHSLRVARVKNPSPFATHPNPDQLAAFRLGTLGEVDADAIARHLGDCEVCREAVDAMPADSFVGLLRSLRSTTPLPAGGGLDQLKTAEPPPELLGYPKYRIVRELGKGAWARFIWPSTR